MSGGPLRLGTQKQFDEFCALYRGTTIVAHFGAVWSEPCKQVDQVLAELKSEVSASAVTLCCVESEKATDACLRHSVVAVPTVLFIVNGVCVDRVDGVYPAEITKKVRAFNDGTAKVDTSVADIRERLRTLVNRHRCMLFMKGSPAEPKCGFSKQAVALLDALHCDYGHFDILSNEAVRQSLKEYSHWPTYPQLYVDGNLLGGVDIMKEMHENGELDAALPKKANLEDRLKMLVRQAPVMVFMKGDPEAPQCKFSRALMGIFNQYGVKFDSFNILEDEAVRQGLKQYSNWPTYPQIYVEGELIGGVDIIKELHEGGELKQALKME